MNNMTLTQAMTYLETLLNQQMSDEAEEAIRTVLDGMKQRVAVSEVDKLKQALSLACTELVEVEGSCPYDKYNLVIDCDIKCNNQFAECWGKCFIGEADRLIRERK